MKKPLKNLIVIAGPTAIGKTKLAIELAKLYQTEIISFDSRQFYKEMQIGTAVPSIEELNEIPHHFIQNLSVHQDYSVGDFERVALKKIEELFQSHSTVIMVGGSGLYEKAVTEGLDQFPDVEKSVRQNLIYEFDVYGIEHLLSELKSVDPVYYELVDQNNHVRIIRALEIYRGTGQTYSSFRKNNFSARNFNILKIVLELPREQIYDRINQRVDMMMSNGLLDEARSLYPYKHLNSLQTVGYRELFDYLDGKIDLEFAIEEIKKNTRRYAKRQLTWYRKDERAKWINPNHFEDIKEYLQIYID